jgi:hypothetical protein
MEAIVPPKPRLQLNRLHGVISQKMILFSSVHVRMDEVEFQNSLAVRKRVVYENRLIYLSHPNLSAELKLRKAIPGFVRYRPLSTVCIKCPLCYFVSVIAAVF